MMRIIVLIKEIPNLADSYVSKSQQTLIFNSPPILNPVDENTIELALQLKEKNFGEVIAIGLGPEDLEIKLKDALAMGCDEAYHIMDPIFEGVDSLQTAIILSRAIKKLGPFDLIIAGSGSITGNGGQVGIRVAEILNLNQAIKVKGVKIEELNLPALITVLKDSNCPRIPTAVGIAKAAHKKLTRLTSSDLGMSQDDLEKTKAFDLVREYLS